MRRASWRNGGGLSIGKCHRKPCSCHFFFCKQSVAFVFGDDLNLSVHFPKCDKNLDAVEVVCDSTEDGF